MIKPTPVHVSTVCSVCGLPWSDHSADPTAETCIRLLKAELARRPLQTIPWTTTKQRWHPYPFTTIPWTTTKQRWHPYPFTGITYNSATDLEVSVHNAMEIFPYHGRVAA